MFHVRSASLGRLIAAFLHPPQAFIELAAITLLWLLYLSLIVPASVIGPFNQLDVSPVMQAWLDPNYRQPGIEHERLAGVLVPMQIGLERYGHIPTWNPYLGDGEPTINNPFSYLFNPFYSLPVLVLGGVQGSKLATILSLLIAGYSMWALAKAVSIGGVGRVTAGALYMMSGGIAAKFFTGHFQLGLSLAWLPLVFAGLWWTLRSQDRRAPVLMAVAFALLFTSGNIYYALHTLVCCLVIFAAHLFVRNNGQWRIQWRRVQRVAIGGVFAVGLSALQFLPVLATSSFIVHEGDPELNIRYSLEQALVNLIFPWEEWGLAFDDQPPMHMLVVVDYNTIGAAPFLLMAGAAVSLLLTRRRRRSYNAAAGIALLLALVMMIWGAGQTSVVQSLYANVSLLAQFRYVGRALAVAALWWIVLAGIAVDVLWSATRMQLHAPSAFDSYDRVRLLRAFKLGILVWGYLLVYSLAGNTARLFLAFQNYALVNRLDSVRFTSFVDSLNGFWVCLLAALVIDTLLLTASRLLRWTRAHRYGWRGVAARIMRLALLLVMMVALSDIAQVNSQLMPLQPLLGSFIPFYEHARNASPDTPFPSFQEPHSPFTFDGYYAETRNWGLDEGWRPAATPGIILETTDRLQNLPQWVIVWNAFGFEVQEIVERFAGDFGYQRQRCISLDALPAAFVPCDLSDEFQYSAALYEKPDVLPYAFIVSAESLETDPAALNREHVISAQVLSHRQDTITIQAEHPKTQGLNASTEPEDYYLVVLETHFPGWHAFADGVLLDSTTLAKNYDEVKPVGFIGVRLLPGSHTYTLRFQPPGLAAGVVIFLITMGLVGFYLFPVKPKHDKSQPENPAGS